MGRLRRWWAAAFGVASAAALCGCSSLDPLPVGAAGQGGGAAGGAGGEAGSPPAPYTIQAFDRERISSDPAEDNFHRIRTSIDLRHAPFARVALSAELDTTCYPFESWTDNPPPPGENWPADCDAFDRNFEIVLDPPLGRDPLPALEIVRAITPFGGPLQIQRDITDLANAWPGRHRLQVRIPTWSDGSGQVTGSNGGWFVSVRVDVTPGEPPRQVLAAVPLYYDSQRSLPGPGPLSWTAPPGTASGRIEYRATGHGGAAGGAGCIGPAEEFCRRTHRFSVDGKEIAEHELWRDDCDELCTIAHYGPIGSGFDYCLENPCGAVGSVRAPRANWCPGSVTPPLVFEPAAIGAPGSHTFEWTISELREGGSWRISATAYAFGD